MTRRRAALSLRVAGLLVLLELLVLGVRSASGQNRITVTAPGGFSRQQLAFVHSGTFGLVLSGNPPNGQKLLSFSTDTGQIADTADLSGFEGASTGTPGLVFGEAAYSTNGQVLTASSGQTKAGTITYYATETFPITVHAFGASGLVTLSGQDSSGTQIVEMFLVDQQGKLSLQWQSSFGSPVNRSFSVPGAAFSSDGSRLYVQYLTQGSSGSFGESLALVNCSDGTTVDSIALPGGEGDPGLLIDSQNNRLIMLGMGSSTLYIIPESLSALTVSATIQITRPHRPRHLIAIVGGKFALTYGGAAFGASAGQNVFYSTNLGTGATKESDVPQSDLPFGNTLALDGSATANAGAVLAPYSTPSVTIAGVPQPASPPGSGTNTMSIIPLGASGRLQSSLTVSLPAADLIVASNNAIASKSGAIVFLATGAGALVSIDAENGTMVNSTQLDAERLRWIELNPETNQIFYSNGVILGAIPAPDHAVISSVNVGDSSTVIQGANFLKGATVTVNGKEISASPGESPGSEITIKKGKKFFSGSSQFTIIVTNRDGLSSDPFTLKP
ncbi:MAG TPA: hypothetical protein VEZ90_13030 [Blastocatellia bacterium]|nr:hypothetical protein [Blastocatellia bacterium]